MLIDTMSSCILSAETCVSYEKPGESNMAVVEVEMISGFIPNKGSLKALKENAELGK